MPSNDIRTLTRSTKAAVVHKVIDITPSASAPVHKSPLQQVFTLAARHRGATLALGVALAVAAISPLFFHGHQRQTAAAHPATPAAQPAKVFSEKTATQAVAAAPAQPQKPLKLELNLPTAVQQGLVECLWRGNGKDRLVIDARNTSDQPLALHLAAGQLLASVDSTITLVRSEEFNLAPHSDLHRELTTVATSSANKVSGAEFHLSAGTLPDMDKLFAYVAAHPDRSAAAVQTATLILTENLPLSAFARFSQLRAGGDAVQESQDFKVDTADLLEALMIVKDLGIERPLAVTIDPQLEVEAMIDPAAHSLAVKYYGIADEWGYWKNQLLNGDPSTRHYALFGIARFYPNVALQMLPKWARGESMAPVFRMSAVQALAQTRKAEAIPILRELEREFGGNSELGRAAHTAANYLDAQFARMNPVPLNPHKPAIASTGG